MTLGFICEQVKETGTPMLAKDQENILAGIFKGIAKDNGLDIKLTSVKALRDAVAFMQALFRMPEIRALTLNSISEIVLGEAPVNLKEHAFQVVFELCKHCYELLEDRLDQLTHLTVPFIADAASPARLRKAGLEVWAILACEYK
jgi:hypothetical protein